MNDAVGRRRGRTGSINSGGARGRVAVHVVIFIVLATGRCSHQGSVMRFLGSKKGNRGGLFLLLLLRIMRVIVIKGKQETIG